jgi:hypothetical protein
MNLVAQIRGSAGWPVLSCLLPLLPLGILSRYARRCARCGRADHRTEHSRPPCHALCKYQHDGAFVSWHQDGYYLALREPLLVSAPSGLEIACEVDECDATDVVSRAGEMSLHHVNLVHGSNANDSAQPRLGFAVRYVAPSVRQCVAKVPTILARERDEQGYFESVESSPVYSFDEAITAQPELVPPDRGSAPATGLFLGDFENSRCPFTFSKPNGRFRN